MISLRISTLLTNMSPNERFEILWSFVEKRIPVFMVGPAGSGKSYVGLQIMRRYLEVYYNGSKIINLRDIDEFKQDIREIDIKALYVAGSANVTKLDLLGGRLLIGGQYLRKPGHLKRMIDEGGIVFIDELTSLPPQFTILLNEMIDSIFNKSAHENFYIFFAGNPSTYVGANEIPDSLLERVAGIWFDYYPLEDEVKIVYSMLNASKNYQDITTDPDFMVFLEFIVAFLRSLRRNLEYSGEICPISVRSMYLAVNSILSFRGRVQPKIEVDRARASVYQIISGDLPDNLVEIWKNRKIDALFRFMKNHQIGWNHIREGIISLGILSKFIGSPQIEDILSRFP